MMTHATNDSAERSEPAPIARVGSVAGSAITFELTEAIRRLETVAYRLCQTQRAMHWARRQHDADILEMEVIPALRRALKHASPNAKAEPRGPQP